MIVTLLTDFGTRDSYVAEMKGVLLAGAPTVDLVDVTHEVAQGDVRSTSYLLGRTWRRFPTGTIHLVVVDPGVGTERRAIAVAAHGHAFVAPDNGVLSPVLDEAYHAVALPVPRGAARTFHGRDVFAPAAARLAAGEALDALGSSITDLTRLPAARAQQTKDGWVGEVVHVDRFGTLVTNLPADLLDGTVCVELPGGYSPVLGATFGDAEPGGLVAYAGSGGTVEIAVRDGSAAVVTGLAVGARATVRSEV